jgi:hypothetical protein
MMLSGIPDVTEIFQETWKVYVEIDLGFSVKYNLSLNRFPQSSLFLKRILYTTPLLYRVS